MHFLLFIERHTLGNLILFDLINWALFVHFRLFKDILEAAVNCNEISFYEDGSWRPINDSQGIKHICLIVYWKFF